MRLRPAPAVTSPAAAGRAVVAAENSPSEEEASRLADAALRSPGTPPHTARASHPRVDPALPGPAVEAARRATAGGGVPLSRAARDDFEPRFGIDLGSIRIHADGEAARAAAAISAQAYALGSHIAFAPGSPSPASGAGRELLAHELAHVVLSHPADAPVIHRKPAPKPTPEPPREKPKLVAIEAKLGAKVGTAMLSDDTSVTITLVANDVPPGTYELLQTQQEGEYRWAAPVVDPDDPTRPLAFRWLIPYLPGTKERKFATASSVTLTISLTAAQRIERLPGHIRKALTTDMGALANDAEIEEVALAGELMAAAGVSAQEMILYDERIKAAKFSGETLAEGSALEFAQSFLGRRRAAEQTTAERLGDLVLYAQLLENEPLHLLSHDLLGSVLDPESYKVELAIAIAVFKAYRVQGRTQDFAALDTAGKEAYLKNLAVGFKTLLLRFERALLADLRAYGNQALDAAEASILLMDRSFTGIWQEVIPAPAWLEREVERINQSEPIVRATDERIATNAAIDAETILDRRRFRRESGFLGPSLQDTVAFAAREEEREARREQAEAAFEAAVRKNSSLSLPAGSSARSILEAKDGRAAVTLLKDYLIDGRQKINAARRKIGEDRVLYAADVWIKDEQDRLKALLGASLGSRIATLIDQFTRLRRSQTTFWEDLVHVVEFVSMFVPGPLGWGLRGAAAVASADITLSKQYAQRALYVAGGSNVDASSSAAAFALLNIPLNMVPEAGLFSKTTGAPQLGLNAIERTATTSVDDAARLATQSLDDATKAGTHTGSGGAGAPTRSLDDAAGRSDTTRRLDDPAPTAQKPSDEPTPKPADEPAPARTDEPEPAARTDEPEPPARTDEPERPARTDEPEPAARTDEPTPARTDEPAPAPQSETALDDAVRAEAALKERSQKRIDELSAERAKLEPQIAELLRKEALYREVAATIRREISAIKASGRPTQEAQRLLDMLATRADRATMTARKRAGKSEAAVQLEILTLKLRESEDVAQRFLDQAAKPRARVGAIKREIDKLSGIALLPERAGGSYRRVSDKTVDGLSEANHLPAWDSYQGQVPLSHGDGPAIFMLEADHRRLASTGSGADAIKHRAKQRELISQGKFLEAFEMDVADITLKCPDGRYTKAIQQARMYLAKLADEGKLKPIR